MQCSGMNSCHQLRANIFGAERPYTGGIYRSPKLALEIRNEQKVMITENVCREEESLATEKQVQSFIDNMPGYLDEWLYSAMARQFTGLKMSNTLSTNPEKKANPREVSGMNSWHQLKTKLIWEGRWSISVENDWTKSPLEIRNEEKVGLTKEFCRKEESLADVKQVESFINKKVTNWVMLVSSGDLNRDKRIELVRKEVSWVQGSGMNSWHQLRANLLRGE